MVPVIHISSETLVVLRRVIQFLSMMKDIFELGKQILKILILCASAAAQPDISKVLCKMFKDVKTVCTDDCIPEIDFGNFLIWFIKINGNIFDSAQFAFTVFFIQSLVADCPEIIAQKGFLSVRQYIDDCAIFKIHKNTDIKGIKVRGREIVLINGESFRNCFSGNGHMLVKDLLDFGYGHMVSSGSQVVSHGRFFQILENIDFGFVSDIITF